MENTLLSVDNHTQFLKVLQEVSGQLESLRSLTISTISPLPSTLSILSESFPRLTHLTLWMSFGDSYQPNLDEGGVSQKGTLEFEQLEILFLYPLTDFHDLISPSLPRLHTVYCGYVLNW